jgi:AcrR family transcriptional regulator
MEPNRSRRKKQDRSSRLSREAWLAQALDVLARHGNAKLRVETIAAALGVTTGSFYWHFKDRDEFLESLVRYWGTMSTDPVIEHVSNLGGDARQRLIALTDLVMRGDYARFDVSVRAWAAQEPAIQPLVIEVDRRRLAFVRSLFAELGFEGSELEMRTRACIGYISLDPAIRDASDDSRRFEMLERFQALITRP